MIPTLLNSLRLFLNRFYNCVSLIDAELEL